MTQHKILQKLELAGLLALVGFFQPGLHPQPIDTGLNTVEIEAALKPTVKVTYFKGTKKIKKKVTTSYTKNNKISKMVTVTYNQAGKVIKKVTKSKYGLYMVEGKKKWTANTILTQENNSKGVRGHTELINNRYTAKKNSKGALITDKIYSPNGKAVVSKTVLDSSKPTFTNISYAYNAPGYKNGTVLFQEFNDYNKRTWQTQQYYMMDGKYYKTITLINDAKLSFSSETYLINNKNESLQSKTTSSDLREFTTDVYVNGKAQLFDNYFSYNGFSDGEFEGYGYSYVTSLNQKELSTSDHPANISSMYKAYASERSVHVEVEYYADINPKGHLIKKATILDTNKGTVKEVTSLNQIPTWARDHLPEDSFF